MLRIEPVSQNVCLQWPLAGCPPKEVRFEGGGEGLRTKDSCRSLTVCKRTADYGSAYRFFLAS